MSFFPGATENRRRFYALNAPGQSHEFEIRPSPRKNLLDELQTTLAHGTVARRVETLRRVTDLFINGAVDYSDEQIALFDDVFQCLIGTSRPPPRRCSPTASRRSTPRRR
jgi:hypothetical protein